MYRVPPDRAWWLAVGPRLERGVRRQCVGAAVLTLHYSLPERSALLMTYLTPHL